MTQPEALRLADWCDAHSSGIYRPSAEAAAELRRLHAENEALREANEAFGKRQEWWNEKMFALEQQRIALLEALKRIMDWDAAGLALTEDHAAQASAAIAKAEGGKE